MNDNVWLLSKKQLINSWSFFSIYTHLQENLYFYSTAADHAILISNWILPNVLATVNQWRGDAMPLETKEHPLKHRKSPNELPCWFGWHFVFIQSGAANECLHG